MDIVHTCVASAPSSLSHYMNIMGSLDNIPRQEKKFVNFASNSLQLRGNNKKIVDEIWGLLKAEREKRIAIKEKEQQAENEKKELAEKEKGKQQEKEKEASKTEEKKSSKSDSDVSIDAKKVKKIAKKTLKKAPNRSMKMKELRKVLGKEMGLPKRAKDRLKAILLDTASASKDKIKIDGKIICLKN